MTDSFMLSSWNNDVKFQVTFVKAWEHRRNGVHEIIGKIHVHKVFQI